MVGVHSFCWQAQVTSFPTYNASEWCSNLIGQTLLIFPLLKSDLGTIVLMEWPIVVIKFAGMMQYASQGSGAIDNNQEWVLLTYC